VFAQLEARDKGGVTPLMMAAWANNPAVLSVFD